MTFQTLSIIHSRTEEAAHNTVSARRTWAPSYKCADHMVNGHMLAGVFIEVRPFSTYYSNGASTSCSLLESIEFQIIKHQLRASKSGDNLNKRKLQSSISHSKCDQSLKPDSSGSFDARTLCGEISRLAQRRDTTKHVLRGAIAWSRCMPEGDQYPAIKTFFIFDVPWKLMTSEFNLIERQATLTSPGANNTSHGRVNHFFRFDGIRREELWQ
jgi:hypothetical protein